MHYYDEPLFIEKSPDPAAGRDVLGIITLKRNREHHPLLPSLFEEGKFRSRLRDRKGEVDNNISLAKIFIFYDV